MKEIRANIPSEWADTLARVVECTEDKTVRYVAVVWEDEDGSFVYSYQGYPEARNMLCSALEARMELDRLADETHPGPFN